MLKNIWRFLFHIGYWEKTVTLTNGYTDKKYLSKRCMVCGRYFIKDKLVEITSKYGDSPIR